MTDTRYHHTAKPDRDSVAEELDALDARIGSWARKMLVGLLVTAALSAGSTLLMGARWQATTDAQIATTTRRVVALEASEEMQDGRAGDVTASLARVSAQIQAMQRELEGARQDVRELRAAVTRRRR